MYSLAQRSKPPADGLQLRTANVLRQKSSRWPCFWALRPPLSGPLRSVGAAVNGVIPAAAGLRDGAPLPRDRRLIIEDTATPRRDLPSAPRISALVRVGRAPRRSGASPCRRWPRGRGRASPRTALPAGWPPAIRRPDAAGWARSPRRVWLRDPCFRARRCSIPGPAC